MTGAVPPSSVQGPSSKRSAQVVLLSVAVVAGLLLAVFVIIPYGAFVAPLADHAPHNPTYSVTFSVGGLRSPSSWSVSMAGHSKTSTGALIEFALPNGTYSYNVTTTQSNTTVAPAAGTLQVTGIPLNISVRFTQPTAALYSVTFTQYTLPPDTPWSVWYDWGYTLTWGNEIIAQFPNGTYPFTVTPEPGYIPTPASGSVNVTGSNITVPIVFTPAPVYPLTFYEHGLPAGSGWYVTLDYTSSATKNTSHTFWLSNGTYPYLIGPAYVGNDLWAATPANGTAVIQGMGVSVNASFYPEYYGANFNETGLPSGTFWTLNLTVNGNASQSEGTDASEIGFYLPNGTYGFNVGPIAGYTATPLSGSFTIHGNDFSQTIQFKASGAGPYVRTFARSVVPPPATPIGAATATPARFRAV
jgi:hypothetical protein